MPSRGFPINQLAISLMLESPKEIYRNESCEILKKSLLRLEELNQTFLHEFCNAESTFDTEFCEQKVLIDLAISQIHNTIAEHAEKTTEKNLS